MEINERYSQGEIGVLMMERYSIQWIEAWCVENGWTDLFIERGGNYWAFPPGGVMQIGRAHV